MEIKIEKLVYPGRSLGFHEGQVVFTDEGLPGELVRVKILSSRKNFMEATTLEIIEPSPARIKPRCSHYRSCSPYQTMIYSLETQIKSQQLEEILSGFKIPFPPARDSLPGFEFSPKIYGYRNKIKLNISWDRENPFFAYHQPGSQTVLLPVESCALVSDQANSLLFTLSYLIQNSPIRSIDQVEIRESFTQGELLVTFYSRGKKSLNEAARQWLPELALNSRLAGATGIITGRLAASPVPFYGRSQLEEKIGQIVLHYGPQCFFQVNLPMLIKVVVRLQSWLKDLKPARLLDLYAGVGTFGLLLSDYVSEVLAVESERENIFYFQENLKLNHLKKIRLAAGRVEDRLKEIASFKPDVALVDPPRKGLDPELIATLKRLPVRSIFYLSCDPATLGRDLNRFLPEFQPVEIRGFDFFPRTPHLEVLTRLERAN
ncbi:MAG: 23S rRNA (uracil(1939)-C(5))-methyltransferase RlmD [Acidobacteriota bacterium]|nr:23S rRNA (uracil(1939)-C(5))-methyltransferase RlmD [Acidobacteriota bacterium]